MHDIKRILVVSSWTKDCKKALHNGISLARTYHAELSVLHVIRDAFELTGGLFTGFLADLKEEYESTAKEAKRDLDAMIEAEHTQGMTIKETILHGEPAAEILKTIQKGKIDLVIMAHHQEDHLEHYLFCRDYETVIRKMPCSIMLVKSEPWEVDKKTSRRRGIQRD